MPGVNDASCGDETALIESSGANSKEVFLKKFASPTTNGREKS